ncbi:MAG: acetolactate synthase, large subunit, biosynthetic type, partial [Mogibacterium sp.]|nr:acetolactate synthase, large subunit, biosynthetic type [Mogibacterium sp.]
TGGMGTMGYSIPAAMGAKMVSPERQTVAVCGDGVFQMCMSELATMKANNVDLKIVIMRNGYLGLVKEYQYNLYDGHYEGVKLAEWPKYDKIAEAYEIKYMECSSNEELDAKVDEFLAAEGACLMVCDVDAENRVK